MARHLIIFLDGSDTNYHFTVQQPKKMKGIHNGAYVVLKLHLNPTLMSFDIFVS